MPHNENSRVKFVPLKRCCKNQIKTEYKDDKSRAKTVGI